MDKSKQIVDVIGIGIGPSNLSFAALSQPTGLSYRIFEKNNEFHWHPGMLLNHSQLQVHYLKDCVSLVDPTNKFSFLNFLTKNRRLYQFLNRKSEVVSRAEFNYYYRWVADQLPHLYFSEQVENVKINREGVFVVTTSKGVYHSYNVICSTGQQVFVPDKYRSYLSENVFHSRNYKSKKKNFGGKRIVVIGGGQSGAEIVYDILSEHGDISSIVWASKRLNFHPLEDSCFSNEFYTPSYCRYFYRLPEHIKPSILHEQVLTSDGISQDLIDAIYRKLYENKFIESGQINYEMLPKHSLDVFKKEGNEYLVEFFDMAQNAKRQYTADIVIFSTGYQSVLPPCINALQPEIAYLANGELDINYDYSLNLNLEQGTQLQGKFYVENLARHTHGIADPNLSLLAWRNSKIINSMLRKEFYDTVEHTQMLFSNEAEPLQSEDACGLLAEGV